jgi:hypothetical protein
MMSRTVVLACALALSGVVAAPAFADCATDLKAAEDAAAKITDASQKADAEKYIAKAQTALAASNEKACGEQVAAANAALTTKPAMKP